MEQSQICHRKRAEFITAISKGLVPPETPPGLRKKRRKYSMETEDVSNIYQINPIKDPWGIAFLAGLYKCSTPVSLVMAV